MSAVRARPRPPKALTATHGTRPRRQPSELPCAGPRTRVLISASHPRSGIATARRTDDNYRPSIPAASSGPARPTPRNRRAGGCLVHAQPRARKRARAPTRRPPGCTRSGSGDEARRRNPRSEHARPRLAQRPRAPIPGRHRPAWAGAGARQRLEAGGARPAWRLAAGPGATSSVVGRCGEGCHLRGAATRCLTRASWGRLGVRRATK